MCTDNTAKVVFYTTNSGFSQSSEMRRDWRNKLPRNAVAARAILEIGVAESFAKCLSQFAVSTDEGSSIVGMNRLGEPAASTETFKGRHEGRC